MAFRRALAVLLALACACGVAACGKGSTGGQGSGSGPSIGAPKSDERAAEGLGFPIVATKNTTRVGAADATATAAAVARAVFPGSSDVERPKAVTLADGRDWRAVVAASVLMAPPVRAPLLLSDGTDLPPATRGTLNALRPLGSDAIGGAQVARIGDVPRPKGLKSTDVSGANIEALAAGIDRLATAAAGSPSDAVIVISEDAPQYGMPVAAYAAKSGVPVLFTKRDRLPDVTLDAIRRHGGARVFVVGPETVVGAGAIKRLARLGPVRRISGRTPIDNAIAFARYSSKGFGWGVDDPGHGFVFADLADPAAAGAASALSSSGTYGPLLLVGPKGELPPAVAQYLLDVQPGYRTDPVRGLYNHGWLIGDDEAISASTQSRIDTLLEISKVQGSN